MPTPQNWKTKFWKALKSDRTMMLGLDGVEDGHARPMTAQLEGRARPDLVLHLEGQRDWCRSSAQRRSRDRHLRLQGP